MTTIKAQYQNGNYVVQLWEDGTKLRLIDTPQSLSPIWPESLDIKITNRCDGSCPYCHEESERQGECFKVENAWNLLKDLPAGVELAFGGGNPLCCKEELLWLFPKLSCVTNLTVHAQHLSQLGKLKPTALGISYEESFHNDIEQFSQEYGEQIQVVVHLIAGVHTIEDLQKCLKSFNRVLILGYKQVGRGIAFYKPAIKNNLSNWQKHIRPYLYCPSKVVSFDNLAVQQLNINSLFTKEVWERIYMGDDGLFSMYLDLVKMEFAESSTAKMRYKIENGLSIQEMFQRIRKNRLDSFIECPSIHLPSSCCINL